MTALIAIGSAAVRMRSSSRRRTSAPPVTPLAEPSSTNRKSNAKGKGKQKPSAKLTLYDIKEQPVKGKIIQHVRHLP